MARAKKEAVEQVEMSVEELEADTVELKGVEPNPDEFEEMDGEEQIVPGGPTYDQVEDWNNRFGKVFMTQIEDITYVYRPIRRNEYKAIMKIQNTDRYYTEEKICATCVLFPSNFQQVTMSNGLAGVPTVIAEMILEKSGFSPSIQSIQL